MTRAHLLCALGLTLACSSRKLPPPPCDNDSQCEEGQVCFPEGCAAPDTDLVIEVSANVAENRRPQEFFVATLGTEQNLSVPPQPILNGSVTVQTSKLDPTPRPYTETVNARVFGTSQRITHLSRSYVATFTPSSSNAGLYQIAVGVGVYSVVVTPADPVMPPYVASGLEVGNGEARPLNIQFPALDALLSLQGTLVKGPAGAQVPVGVPMTLQALHLLDRHPLSQRVTVAEGSSTFTLNLSPDVLNHDRFLIVATPTPEVLLPEKTFEATRATALAGTTTLNLGDFGSAVAVSGTIVAQDGSPVPNAVVYLEGEVSGGGRFQSQNVPTDAAGNFTVQTLPSNGSTYTLWAVPPAKSFSGILQHTVEVTPAGQLVGAPFVCPNRVNVSGPVLLPNGSPAANVKVVAQPLETVGTRPLPTFPGDVITDAEGRYAFPLDSAAYRFEFRPPVMVPPLPRVSRIIHVESDRATIPAPLSLPEFTLSRGREVKGLVTASSAEGSAEVPASGASVRIFKVGLSEAGASLVAETVADETGVYTVTVPTR